MFVTWATQGDREHVEERGMNMSKPAGLLQAAKYALRPEGNRDRAEALAMETVNGHPNSTEAQNAKDLLREFFGTDGSAAESDEQQRRGPKLTPEQDPNLQRHLMYQKGERNGEQSYFVTRKMMHIVLLVFLAAGITILVAGLKFNNDGLDILALASFALGGAISFYALKGIINLM